MCDDDGNEADTVTSLSGILQRRATWSMRRRLRYRHPNTVNPDAKSRSHREQGRCYTASSELYRSYYEVTYSHNSKKEA